MGADAGTIVRLSRLLVDGAIDTKALHDRHEEIASLLAQPEPSRSDLLVLGVNLHAYYTALETLLERVARLVDEDVPNAATWHRDLLLQMRIDLPGLRPAVIPPETIPDLDELRKFRHFFRNAYVLDLDREKTLGHAGRVVRVHPPLASSVARFLQHVEAVRRVLSTS
jgi:hypothetical protein